MLVRVKVTYVCIYDYYMKATMIILLSIGCMPYMSNVYLLYKYVCEIVIFIWKLLWFYYWVLDVGHICNVKFLQVIIDNQWI